MPEWAYYSAAKTPFRFLCPGRGTFVSDSAGCGCGLLTPSNTPCQGDDGTRPDELPAPLMQAAGLSEALGSCPWSWRLHEQGPVIKRLKLLR